MKSLLHILHLEDDPHDAALIQSTLEHDGIVCATTRVENRDNFVTALENGGFDMVFSDFSMPTFDGISAAKIVRNRWPELPIILVSGTLGEERAIDALKNGVTDYVLKDRLARLAPAVRRAMLEVEERLANRRTEAALRETEQRLRIIFNESALGIALVGLDGRPILTNVALNKILGYTREELSGLALTDFTHLDDCAEDMEICQELIRGVRQSFQTEKRYVRKDAQVVWARLTVSVAHSEAGRTGPIVVMVEDITERRRLETQFIEAQKMEVMGQLASGVAHDFNNILSAISGYCDSLTEDLGPKSAHLTHTGEIKRTVGRATRLTQQLLTFSRRQKVQFVTIDLNVEVFELATMLKRLVGPNIKMTMVPGNSIGPIRSDTGYIGQLLMNLVINARDAMPNGGELTIKTANVTLEANHAFTREGVVSGDHVMLSVNDTGSGMSDEVKAHLFEAFFTTKPVGCGTGLGLATCHTIVQLCSGHIEVQSKPDQGTMFKIYFPRVDEPLDVVPVAAVGPLPRVTETLLIVEDEPGVEHMACRVLKKEGYKILSATNGQDALRLAREHTATPIHLVLTDVNLPLMGGKELTQCLKLRNPGLKLLFTSGFRDEAISELCVTGGEIDFLTKPYTPLLLVQKVRDLLDRRNTNRTERITTA